MSSRVFIRSLGKAAVFLIAVSLFISCALDSEKQSKKLFALISKSESGLDFANNLTFDQNFNIYTYRNFYNGGGVAIGDINNDGLLDVYLTGNQVSNKLFLNKGNFHFEDVTEKAGVGGKQNWSTGVAMADVNGDGLLDIYLCSSGNVEGDPKKQNELFINNGDLTFSEKAKEFGIADKGYTTHAAFFDYDKDGDLDLYILNNSYQAIGSFNLRKNERPIRNPLGGHKLMRNDGDHFVDVSEKAGIYGSVISFGLGVTIGDIDKDGWEDIYVSNDFFERDYLYINRHDGTFKESLTEFMKSVSAASMGADIADINNDTWPDIFVTDMLPDENARLKTVTTFEDWNRYQYNLENDYYHQFNRNMLQVNNGDNSFCEIGRLAGVEATDWSWGALMFDMDNDGLKDIFVANGIYQDLTNQDFLAYATTEEFVKSILSKNKVDYKKLVQIIPTNPIANYAFRNKGNYSFTNQAKDWGLDQPAFSNGSAYGDLDNDGDLDLIVNNVNMDAFLYRNNATEMLPENHFLKFQLKGEGKNSIALGTKITVEAGASKFYVEQMPTKGFESTVDPRPNIGVGNLKRVDRIIVDWPNGKRTVIDSVATNKTLILDEKDANNKSGDAQPTSSPLVVKNHSNAGIDFEHHENKFVDFDRDRLIYHMLSTEGPRMSKGDVNADGLDDFYVGGAKDQSGALFIQVSEGKFKKSTETVFDMDRTSEDLGSVFFDADGDGDLDLYVCSGGNEFSNSSSALQDRLYLNKGDGSFTKSSQSLPTTSFESTSTVKPGDYDNDGDLDLFVGVRLHPFDYGAPGNGYILNNDGKGNFRTVTNEAAPALKDIGMITDAEWADIDGDRDQDLLIVGEWMAIRVFVNESGKFLDQTESAGLLKSNGWWNRIESADIDNDGDIDFVIGNHGYNSRFNANADKPVCVYISDFDQNGTSEQVLCAYNGDKSYPMVLRHDLVSQIPELKKKYLKYESYKNESITDIFTAAQLEKARKLEVYELATSILLNDGKGKFSLQALPIEAQFSCVYGLEILDVDHDGAKDIVLGGNLYSVKPEAGRYDASYGLILKGKGNGQFRAVAQKQSGLKVDGEIRDIISIGNRKQQSLIISRNNDSIVTYTLN
jgi:hypothetical protein